MVMRNISIKILKSYKNIEANWNGYMRVINQERYIRNGIKQATSNKEYVTSLKREDMLLKMIILII